MTTCLLYLPRRLSPDSDAGVTGVGTLQSDSLSQPHLQTALSVSVDLLLSRSHTAALGQQSVVWVFSDQIALIS
jgi:hypothetical protein